MERQKLRNNLPKKRPANGPKTNINRKNLQPVASQKRKNVREQPYNHFDATPDDSSSRSRPQGASNIVHSGVSSGDGVMGLSYLGADKRIAISLDFKSKKEIRDIRSKLVNELSLVRNLVKRIEHYTDNNMKFPVNGVASTHSGKLKRVHSEIGSVDCSESRPLDQLDIPGIDNGQVGIGHSGKGIRKLKSNEFYQGADPSLGKEKIMPVDQKKSNINGKKSGEVGIGRTGSSFGMGNSSNKVFKSCNALLDKLMKHTCGWIFSSPVDVEGLGLHDYYTIVKHPMDLGTVKSRLNSNRYKTPEDFAEDVRLTFHNAIMYNPEGHDVNALAQQFLKMFEDKWVAIVADYPCDTNASSDYQEDLPNQMSRRASSPASPIQPPAESTTMVDKSESAGNPVEPEPKTLNSVQPVRARAPKPKAKDPNKRDMTFEEKHKLSTSLQNLPSEKLEIVLQIIKKRNPHLCQNDEEIEVDIDSVDIETLWELDRFVINYKKNLSKIKRSAEMAQTGVRAEPNLEEENEAQSAMEEPIENDKNAFSSSPVQAQGEGGSHSTSVSNGSSSSSSDSASSSSDSETDSSSS